MRSTWLLFPPISHFHLSCTVAILRPSFSYSLYFVSTFKACSEDFTPAALLLLDKIPVRQNLAPTSCMCASRLAGHQHHLGGNPKHRSTVIAPVPPPCLDPCLMSGMWLVERDVAGELSAGTAIEGLEIKFNLEQSWGCFKLPRVTGSGSHKVNWESGPATGCRSIARHWQLYGTGPVLCLMFEGLQGNPRWMGRAQLRKCLHYRSVTLESVFPSR